MKLGGAVAATLKTPLTSSWLIGEPNRNSYWPSKTLQTMARAYSNEGAKIDKTANFFQLESYLLLNIERLIKLDSYLQEQVDAHTITKESVGFFRSAVYEFIAAFGSKSGVPDACPGVDGQMIYYLRKDNHSVQMDIKPNGNAELYYLNKRNNNDFFIEYNVGRLVEEVSSTPLIQAAITA
jgi:hypothetical protein